MRFSGDEGKFQLHIKWAWLQLIWAIFYVVAINVGQRLISFAFNLGQFDALIAGQVVFDCEPLQLALRPTDITLFRHYYG